MGTNDARKRAPSSRGHGTFRGRRPTFFLAIDDWGAMGEGEREAFVTATKRKAVMLAHLRSVPPRARARGYGTSVLVVQRDIERLGLDPNARLARHN